MWICGHHCDHRNGDEYEAVRHLMENHAAQWLQTYLLNTRRAEAALRVAVQIIQERLTALELD